MSRGIVVIIFSALIFCLGNSPVLGMQPKKEVKEYKRSFVERHPILAVAAAAILIFNRALPSPEVASIASNPLALQPYEVNNVNDFCGYGYGLENKNCEVLKMQELYADYKI